ncbi:MAG: hypothetical protein EA366_10450 [Spirulina sp. DLM2.Bin59]|nr:MAG: hypothetical protein EA366_10450 [Spirulina sp. DLM2.Bin59]
MDILQKQLLALDCKVDALHRLVEQLSHRLNLALINPSTMVSPPIPPAPFPHPLASAIMAPEPNDEDDGLSHKDVLPDTQRGRETIPDYNTTEQSLSPELQVRRLTAQVTAAYNRIAALEEQLLAQRGNPQGEHALKVERSTRR